jgi:hypothetical protein
VSFLSRVVALALLLLFATVVPASAGTTDVCTVTDHRVIGLSGLVVTRTGFISISDSNIDKSKIRIWYLTPSCHASRSIGYPTPAYDPEDAAFGRDGTLYVADIGDNGRHRPSIAIWSLRPGHTIPTIKRYAYPDGPHDAEALLLAADDSPIIVTKDPLRAGIYVPSGPGKLRKAGTFTLTPTGTAGGVGPLGGFVVTGGANSADRRRVALRSYNDAYEWSVPDGDVVKAITTAPPVITPLPDEPQGESIAYAPDGVSFYTVSDQETQPVRTVIRRYPSALHVPAVRVSVPPAPVPTASSSAAGALTPTSSTRSALFLGLAGVILVGGGIWIALRRRTRTRSPR